MLYKKVYCNNHQASLQNQGNIMYPHGQNISNNLNLSNPNINNHSFLGSIQTGFLHYRIPLQLSMIKKWKYNESTAFIDLGCNMLRICNLVFYKSQLFQLASDTIRSVFLLNQPNQPQIWGVTSPNVNSNEIKLKPLITGSKIISHYMTTKI